MILAVVHLAALAAVIAMLVEGRGHAHGPLALWALVCLVATGATLAIQQLS